MTIEEIQEEIIEEFDMFDDWMQRYEPEVITSRYLSLIQDVIKEAEAKISNP